MKRTTETFYTVLPEIRERWSPKAFNGEPVDKDRLRSAFEAARWAPSSYNEQPWRFIVGLRNEGPTYDLIFDSLMEKNKAWAQSAPVLVLTCCKANFTQKEKPNRCALYDTGAAVSQMVLQLHRCGLHARQIAGMDTELARSYFSIPEDYHVICTIAIGILESDTETQYETRTRNDFDDFVFSGSWLERSTLFDHE